MRCALARWCSLVGLEHLWRRHLKLRAKHPVPEPAADTKTILVIREVVLEVVLLQLAPICGQVAVVQEVVSHVIEHVSEDATAIPDKRGVPVVEENEMGELPERCRENREKRRGHDEAVFVHWKVVVNAMKEEVQCNTHAVVGEVAGTSQHVCTAHR